MSSPASVCRPRRGFFRIWVPVDPTLKTWGYHLSSLPGLFSVGNCMHAAVNLLTDE
jgi:hypothetical protein